MSIENDVADVLISTCSSISSVQSTYPEICPQPSDIKSYVYERLHYIERGHQCFKPRPGCMEIVLACLEIWNEEFDLYSDCNYDALNEANDLSHQAPNLEYLLVSMPNAFNWMIDKRMFEEYTTSGKDTHPWTLQDMRRTLSYCVRPYRIYHGNKIRNAIAAVMFTTTSRRNQGILQLLRNMPFHVQTELSKLSAFVEPSVKAAIRAFLMDYLLRGTHKPKMMRIYQCGHHRVPLIVSTTPTMWCLEFY